MDKTLQPRQHKRILHHRGRLEQIPIYLAKLLRSFIYQSDWKFLPMAAIIAALVSMVIRRDGFITMEGTMKASFAFTCVAIWNGCFNSIQSICRERNIVKREHRSGMHISSYVIARMIYQALLCLAQTVITVFVCRYLGVNLKGVGFFTSWQIVDIGITLFFITYASDMLSLLVSSIVHSTTAAMTVMPFLLIFQLVFSGGIFSLPAWTKPISQFTISNYGMKCIAAQADYNNQPMVTAWNTLNKLRDETVGGSVPVGTILEPFSHEDNPVIAKYRSMPLTDGVTLGDALDIINEGPLFEDFRNQDLDLTFRIGDLIDLVGEDRLRNAIQEKTGGVSQNPDYERTPGRIALYWAIIIFYAMVYGLLSIIVLEFIDKDKR